LALAVRFVSVWIAPKERIRRLAMNCALMGRCAGLVFMTLAPKAQTANSLLRYFLLKHSWFGVPLMRFLPKAIAVHF
jgi:hypothetical protein